MYGLGIITVTEKVPPNIRHRFTNTDNSFTHAHIHTYMFSTLIDFDNSVNNRKIFTSTNRAMHHPFHISHDMIYVLYKYNIYLNT